MDGALVVLRGFRPEDDQAFIYATWRHSSYYGQQERPNDSKDEAREKYKALTKTIRKILARPKTMVLVACLEDDPDLIVGYLISEGTHMHWVYVKEDYRKKGIATILGLNHYESYSNDITKIGQLILNKKNNKENSHGRTDSRIKEEARTET